MKFVEAYSRLENFWCRTHFAIGFQQISEFGAYTVNKKQHIFLDPFNLNPKLILLKMNIWSLG